MRLSTSFYSFLFILFFPLLLFSGTTGKIAGAVSDKTNGEPLIGVNILIEGTMLGATSDLDGEFFILNIPPGKYTVEAQYIGYSTVKFENVNISVDQTTELNITLQEAVLELSEDIVVIAKREMISKDVTATTAKVDAEQFDKLPVTEVSEALELQAGYVDGHVRGGRTGEVAYWIDGMPVTDKYDGGTVVEVNKDMVEELQFISGAFNAEYGQAMSGVVNITTKEPSKDFGGSLNLYAGDYLSQNDDIFWNTGSFDPSNIYNADLGLYGTIIPSKLSYYLNARYIYFGGWQYGRRDYNPQNIAVFDKALDVAPSRDPEGVGDGAYIPMNWNRKIYLQGKLIFNISPVMKLFYNYIRDDVEFEEYDRSYKLNPDGNLNRFRVGNSHIAKFTHTISPSTYYDLGFSLFQKSYRQSVYEDSLDTRYIHPRINDLQQAYTFKTGGTNNQYFTRDTKTLLGKLDVTSQLSRRHLIKVGLEARYHTIFFEDITLRPREGDDLDLETGSPFITPYVPGENTPYYSQYERNPTEFSAYIQDKMEFSDLIVNLGVRIDHFRPDGVVLADPSDPDVYNPIRPVNTYRDVNGDGLPDIAEENKYTLAERERFWYNQASNKTQISPRIGVSFPVTETGVVYFSYGHFFQTANFELLYRNPQFKLGTGTGNQGTIGNTDLDPEFTISGEIGLKQQISSDLAIDVTAFFRDVRDLTGTRSEEIVIFGGSSSYSRLTNSDFGFIKGIIISLRNSYRQGFNYTLDYTFQVAKGTASDPNSAQLAFASGNLPEIQMVPLSWDQLHTLNGTLSYVGNYWGLSVIGRYGSGLPYTPRASTDVSALRENSRIKPAFWNVDLRLYKDFDVFEKQLTFFLRIFNLFDTLNQLNVYDDSGRADYTTDLNRARNNNPSLYGINTLEEWFSNETFYSEPRRIELGFMFNF
jgi:outer membrane receptor protein involved in Fe transport